jgi:hypothetical protein
MGVREGEGKIEFRLFPATPPRHTPRCVRVRCPSACLTQPFSVASISSHFVMQLVPEPPQYVHFTPEGGR